LPMLDKLTTALLMMKAKNEMISAAAIICTMTERVSLSYQARIKGLVLDVGVLID
jgi:hypothetical protein